MALTSLKEKIDDAVKQQLRLVDMVVSSTGLPIVHDQKTGDPQWVDVRELPLRYMPSLGRTKRFFEGLAEGRLLATKCKECGAVYFPPQSDCPRCRRSDVEWVDVGVEGELVTWATINVKPLTFIHHNDYVVGIVRMPLGVNVLAWIVGDPTTLRPGQRVRLVVGRREPENYITYWFETIQ